MCSIDSISALVSALRAKAPISWLPRAARLKPCPSRTSCSPEPTTLDPLLRHHYRSDDRHQQQQRGDLEGEHILSVQHGCYLLCVVVFHNWQRVLREDVSSLRVDCNK